jgi:dTMP kinase
MTSGKFIVVEGLEGAGKSSAIAVIEQTLAAAGISYVNTREPGGTPLAEALRNLVKSADHSEKVTPECELLLMYASRSQLLENRIKPALAQGLWVIGDRHDMSSQAYQGGGRQFDNKAMQAIADISLKGFKPDLTLYLDIDPQLGLSRASARGELDRIEQEETDFFVRVRNKYLELVEADDNAELVDASVSMSQVHQAVAEAIEKFIKRQR